MTVVIVKPGYAPYEAEINGLHEMQEVVGGTIQAIYSFGDAVQPKRSRRIWRRIWPFFCVRLGRRGLLLFDPGAGQSLQEGISLCRNPGWSSRQYSHHDEGAAQSGRQPRPRKKPE